MKEEASMGEGEGGRGCTNAGTETTGVRACARAWGTLRSTSSSPSLEGEWRRPHSGKARRTMSDIGESPRLLLRPSSAATVVGTHQDSWTASFSLEARAHARIHT